MKKILLFLLCVLPLYSEDIYATFIVKSVQNSTLSLASSGIVENIFVEIGSKVKKGDKLLMLRAKDLEANKNIAKYALQDAQKQYNFIKNQFERYKKSKNVLDENTFEKIKTQFQSSAIKVKEAEANYALQKELLQKTTLLAPFDGVISEKYIEIGDGVGAISSPLFELESLQKKVILAYDSKYFDKVKIHDEFFYNINGSAIKIPLKIIKIYPSIDIKTKKARAEALILDSKIPSGIFGDGFIVEK